MKNSLKELPVSELETIISNAISQAINEKIEASISAINYGNSCFNKADFDISLSTPLNQFSDN